MPQSYLSRFLGTLRTNEERMTELFATLSAAIAAEIVRRANADGEVPREQMFDLSTAIGALVMRFFLGRNRNGEPAPFDILPGGAVFPLSPYMRAMWTAIGEVTRIPVEQHAALMIARLPADLAVTMRNATRNPLVQMTGAVRPNPLARYEPPHRWVDPNGYRLSDRIWNTANNTRRRLDLFLDTSIREGRGAASMARELEQFLQPGRLLRRTNAPYGRDASFDAMRLARTEIARAHAHAGEMSAAMNPFVQGLKWTLSGSHRKRDICDDYAMGGVNGDGVYPIDDHPTMPAHPQDMCRWTYVMIDAEQQQATLDALRDDIRSARASLANAIGPLAVERFTQLLLTGGIATTPFVANPMGAAA
jgi:hypothetical protein